MRQPKKAEERVVYAYVKHPPEELAEGDEKRWRGMALESDLPFEVRSTLWMKRYAFKEKKGRERAVYAIEALLVAHENGQYPPLEVLDYLAGVFKDFHLAQGRKSIDRLMGLIPGKGQASAFKKLAEEERNARLCLDVHRLNRVFGVAVNDAAYMVARRLEDTPKWDNTGFKLKTIGADRLAVIYKNKWRKLFKRHDDLFQKEVWSSQKKKDFISLFPSDSIPNSLKK